AFYNKDYECGISWEDELINIKWPMCENPVLSEKDANLNKLRVEFIQNAKQSI
ncbi:dTDP-4-dehydrorhamnose 3,5-epimerase family protein, partial [Escherichia coli]